MRLIRLHVFVAVSKFAYSNSNAGDEEINF